MSFSIFVFHIHMATASQSNGSQAFIAKLQQFYTAPTKSCMVELFRSTLNEKRFGNVTIQLDSQSDYLSTLSTEGKAYTV
jgi:hypothetical protein